MRAFNERRQMRGQGGFTLVELLVVIAILGILAGVVVFAVGNTTDDAKTNACNVELRAIKTAIAAAEATELATDTSADFLDTGSPKYWSVAGGAGAETIAAVAPNTGTANGGCAGTL